MQKKTPNLFFGKSSVQKWELTQNSMLKHDNDRKDFPNIVKKHLLHWRLYF